MNSINQPHNLTKKLIASGLIMLNVTSAIVSAAQYKHVAVPAEEISKQQLTEAKNKGIFSHSTMLPIYASNETDKVSGSRSNAVEIEQEIYFDGKGDSPIVFIGPDAAQWQLSLTDPNGTRVYSELNSQNRQLPVENIQVGSESFKGKQLLMTSPANGIWRVQLTKQASALQSTDSVIEKQEARQSPVAASGKNNREPIGYLMFKGDPNFQVYSHLDNNFTVENSQLNIVAYTMDSSKLAGNRKLMQQRKALQGTISKAVATITSPSNKQTVLLLKDDGTNGDARAGDGLYSAQVPTNEIGVYTSQVQIEGFRPDGIRYSRTTTDLYPIARAAYEFTDAPATVRQTGQYSGIISLPVEQINSTERVFLSAEVWGAGGKGKQKSAAWVGGIVTPTYSDEGVRLELAMDLRWLQRNNLRAPYTLKKVRLQTVDSNVPLTERASLPLKTGKLLLNNLASGNTAKTSTTITQSMLSLPSPSAVPELSGVTQDFQTHALAGGKLMLVHGYCSGDVWDSGQFSNSVEFQDFKQNRSHDAFALQIHSFGTAYSSYGIVAHSQGGAAALHLYAKYWSGLDNATGGRLIQSVGTPYQGTALAGNLAVLGQIFGAGCGKNTDLTYSGAANWLSTIPSWARAEVDYYTTSFKDRWWAYDYCHLVTDLLLSDPEDGTTEKWSGQLSGAVNKGHKTGWCHTTGMRDTAQYKDTSRNSSMSSRAAR